MDEKLKGPTSTRRHHERHSAFKGPRKPQTRMPIIVEGKATPVYPAARRKSPVPQALPGRGVKRFSELLFR